MSSSQLLRQCAEHQKQMFYKNFLSHNKIGEMICVNGDESGDTILYERWRVLDHDFIVASRLLSEDSMDVAGITVTSRPIEAFVEAKNEECRFHYAEYIKVCEKNKESPKEELKVFTRQDIEDHLPPGKKTIHGNRKIGLVVLERQKDIPNDLQQPALVEYRLTIPSKIETLMLLGENKTEIEEWLHHELEDPPEESIGIIASKLKHLKDVHTVRPVKFTFPEREMDVERELGTK